MPDTFALQLLQDSSLLTRKVSKPKFLSNSQSDFKVEKYEFEFTNQFSLLRQVSHQARWLFNLQQR